MGRAAEGATSQGGFIDDAIRIERILASRSACMHACMHAPASTCACAGGPLPDQQPAAHSMLVDGRPLWSAVDSPVFKDPCNAGLHCVAANLTPSLLTLVPPTPLHSVRKDPGPDTWTGFGATPGSVALHVNSLEGSDDDARQAVIYFDAGWCVCVPACMGAGVHGFWPAGGKGGPTVAPAPDGGTGGGPSRRCEVVSQVT